MYLLPGLGNLYTPVINLGTGNVLAKFFFMGKDFDLLNGTWTDRVQGITLSPRGGATKHTSFLKAGRPPGASGTDDDICLSIKNPGVAEVLENLSVNVSIPADDDIVWEFCYQNTPINTGGYTQIWTVGDRRVPKTNPFRYYAFYKDYNSTKVWITSNVAAGTDDEEFYWQGVPLSARAHIVIAFNKSMAGTPNSLCVFQNGVWMNLYTALHVPFNDVAIHAGAQVSNVLAFGNNVATPHRLYQLSGSEIYSFAQWQGVGMLPDGDAFINSVAAFSRDRFAALTGGTMNLGCIS